MRSSDVIVFVAGFAGCVWFFVGVTLGCELVHGITDEGRWPKWWAWLLVGPVALIWGLFGLGMWFMGGLEGRRMSTLYKEPRDG